MTRIIQVQSLAVWKGLKNMVKAIRRIVAGNDDTGKAAILSDGPSPDVVLDPARPGFASTRIWVTDSAPARVKGIRETLNSPHRLQPPTNGTACRVVEYPPERNYIDRVTESEIVAWFKTMQSSKARVKGGHPYMMRTHSQDLCYLLEGEITLVLETQELLIGAGTCVIVNGVAHAWKNHTNLPAILVMNQLYAADEQALPPPMAVKASEDIAPPPEIAGILRRVVAGYDLHGRSCVLSDGPTPNRFPRPSGSWFHELWTLDEAPARLKGNLDFGCKGRVVAHSPPVSGANWRISYSGPTKAKAPVVAITDSTTSVAMDTGGGTERLQGSKVEGMHRTPSVDYAICLEGDRVLILEDSEVVLNKGDVVIQCGNWHSWGVKSETPAIMSYLMIGGEFG